MHCWLLTWSSCLASFLCVSRERDASLQFPSHAPHRNATHMVKSVLLLVCKFIWSHLNILCSLPQKGKYVLIVVCCWFKASMLISVYRFECWVLIPHSLIVSIEFWAFWGATKQRHLHRQNAPKIANETFWGCKILWIALTAASCGQMSCKFTDPYAASAEFVCNLFFQLVSEITLVANGNCN